MSNGMYDADTIIAALKSRKWPMADLVRIAHAVAQCGRTTTSVLGQYGEDLVVEAFGGTAAPVSQKAYDVRTPNHGDLQVKTFSVGKRPGNIRSFTHDVVTLEVDPSTAAVVSAELYKAADLYAAFQAKYTAKFAALGMVFGGHQEDTFERGWTIPAGLPATDITDLFRESALGR